MVVRIAHTVFVLFVISACISSCAGSKKTVAKRLPGTWQAQPIVIDGKNTDWPAQYPGYDEKAMIGYAVSNDKDNLYIRIETGDLATQLKILKGGLTVWIDRKAEKNEVTAINYPIPQSASGKAGDERRPTGGQMMLNGPDKIRIMLEDKIKMALNDADEYSLQGFKACNLQYPISETDSCGIMVRMAVDADNELVWEAVVPFKSFYYKNEIMKTDKGRTLSICIETTGIKRPVNDGQGSGPRPGGGGRPGMSFGIGAMGMGVQMGGSRPRSTQDPAANITEPLYKSTKTYTKFGLAYP